MTVNIYHIPENQEVMDEIYAVISHDEKGNEGIVSMMTPMGGMPMVFGHVKMLESVKEVMKQIAKESKQTLRIYKYKKAELLAEAK